MPDTTVLLTGISGFLASHIALKLLKSGHTVRGSVRNNKKGEHVRQVLEHHGADTSKLSFLTLDLMSDDNWQEAMDGVSVLVHTASPFLTSIPKDENEVILPAVEGTKRALNAALASGVNRVVLTSSEVAVARGHPNSRSKPFTEVDWSDVNSPSMTPYFKSKTMAEKEAWNIMEKAGRRDDLTVVNPGFILGPLLEEDTGTSGAIIQKMLRGKFPGAPNIYFTIVDVRDAADLHIISMTDKRAFGRRVFASGPSVSFKEIADLLARAFPEYAAKLPTRHLPDFMVRLVGLFDPDARASVRSLGRRFELDHALAEALLGRELLDTNTAVTAMGQSLIEQQLI
jgi:dihydroflavonol-4-reductase